MGVDLHKTPLDVLVLEGLRIQTIPGVVSFWHAEIPPVKAGSGVRRQKRCSRQDGQRKILEIVFLPPGEPNEMPNFQKKHDVQLTPYTATSTF
jgi:hypothetical protein